MEQVARYYCAFCAHEEDKTPPNDVCPFCGNQMIDMEDYDNYTNNTREEEEA